MKKFLTISVNSDRSGAPICARNYIDVLKTANHVVVHGQNHTDDSPLIIDGTLRYQIDSLDNKLNAVDLLRSVNKFKKILQIERPDVVLAHSAVACLIARILQRRYRYKLILINHGWSWRGFKSAKANLIRFVEYFGYLISDTVVVYLSQKEMDNAPVIVKKFSKSVVIPNTTTMIPIVVPEVLQKQAKAVFKIAMIARVDRSKDHELLIKACLNLPFETELVLVGEGTECFTSDKSDQSSTKIVGVGKCENVQPFISTADVICLVSNFETMPLSLIEGMAMGKPLVASDVGSVSEIIDNGKNGFLVENSETQIVAALFKLSDPMIRRRMGKESLFLFNQRFSHKEFTKRVRELLGNE